MKMEINIRSGVIIRIILEPYAAPSVNRRQVPFMKNGIKAAHQRLKGEA